MRRCLILLLCAAPTVHAQDWPQWGRTPQHDNATLAVGGRLDRIEASFVVDPFAPAEEAESNGDLDVHYPVPLLDGDDLYLIAKSGVWSVRNIRRAGATYTTRWTFASDWSPPPFGDPSGGPQWEPVCHPILGGDVVWVPGAGAFGVSEAKVASFIVPSAPMRTSHAPSGAPFQRCSGSSSMAL